MVLSAVHLRTVAVGVRGGRRELLRVWLCPSLARIPWVCALSLGTIERLFPLPPAGGRIAHTEPSEQRPAPGYLLANR